MSRISNKEQKIYTRDALQRVIAGWKATGKTVAFTNGCFDILHRGHLYSLNAAAGEADYLVVAVNSDRSVRKLKGESRPVNDEQSRALVIAALQMVDAVVIFDEENPRELIKTLQPHVLVKGGDYTIDQIAGAREVISYGGKVVLNPIIEGFSTSGIITRLQR